MLFVAYLIWLFYAAGDFVLRSRGSMTLASALLGFFTGVGIWHIVLLFAGFAGFYTRPIMTAASIAVFAFSLPKLNKLLNQFSESRAPVYWPGWLLLMVPLLAFLITKGLYPAGGHDYYNHYFQFYKQVIATGSIMPNDVWYQFYYSKGAGLFFLSMLLTDPLAPQLATTAMICASAAMVYAILNQSASWRLLPWIGVALYLTFLIYTPGPDASLHQGGWGDLEKPHEPAAVLMFAIIWISINLAKTQEWRRYGIALIFSVSALVLISPVMAVFSAAYLSMTALYFFVNHRKQAAYWSAGGVIIAVSWFLFLLLVNYVLTGVPQDQGLIQFWPIINFDKVKEWGVLFELLMLRSGITGLLAHQEHLSVAFAYKIFVYLRLDIWGPLFLYAIMLFGWQKKKGTIDKTSLYACGGFLLQIALLAFIIGREQSVSFYRFTSFTYAPMLCFCLLLLSPVLHHRTASVIGMIIIFLAMLINNFNGGNLGRVLNNSLHFASGEYSIADAYTNQRGWPGRMPWGGIYPAAEVVWSQVPPNTRIWTLNQHSYCMLPDCRFEGHMSYRFSSHADIVYFGYPNEAKAVLQREHLNYFFISNSLALSDPLPLAPLFSVNHIAHYLGIAWTDGDNTLLTWKEDASMPIDTKWLHRYSQQVKASQSVKLFPYQQMLEEMEKAAY